jgi:hypothetical protein
MAPSDKDPKPRSSEREQKLAQALRANLRRRKAGDGKAGAGTVKVKCADEG